MRRSYVLIIATIISIILIIGILHFVIASKKTVLNSEMEGPVGQITYDGQQFEPPILRIQLKNQASVVFLNASDDSLSLKSGTKETPKDVSYTPLNIEEIEPDNAENPYVVRFTQPGIYTYHNINDPEQVGSILVEK